MIDCCDLQLMWKLVLIVGLSDENSSSMIAELFFYITTLVTKIWIY